MSRSSRLANPENVHSETSCFAPEAQARWKGFPIGWLDAAPLVTTRDFELPRPTLAMLEAGVATAEFAFAGGRTASHDFSSGALGLFVPDVHFQSSSWKCQGVRRAMLDIDLSALHLDGCDDDWISAPLQLNTGFADPELSTVMRRMVAEVAANCPNGALYAQSLSLGVLFRLTSTQRQHKAGSQRERGVMTPAQIARVQDLIQASLEGDLDLNALAASAGLGVTHFSRIFKNTFGCTPHHHVLMARIDKAKHLIRHSSLPLAMIAAEAGFSSQSHMTAVFNRWVQSTPGEWRRTGR